jgi:hypothetical protein
VGPPDPATHICENDPIENCGSHHKEPDEREQHLHAVVGVGVGGLEFANLGQLLLNGDLAPVEVEGKSHGLGCLQPHAGCGRSSRSDAASEL